MNKKKGLSSRTKVGKLSLQSRKKDSVVIKNTHILVQIHENIKHFLSFVANSQYWFVDYF